MWCFMTAREEDERMDGKKYELTKTRQLLRDVRLLRFLGGRASQRAKQQRGRVRTATSAPGRKCRHGTWRRRGSRGGSSSGGEGHGGGYSSCGSGRCGRSGGRRRFCEERRHGSGRRVSHLCVSRRGGIPPLRGAGCKGSSCLGGRSWRYRCRRRQYRGRRRRRRSHTGTTIRAETAR